MFVYMKRGIVHHTIEKGRKIFALLAVLWIMLSSCNIQASITNFSALSTSSNDNITKLSQPKKAENSFSTDTCTLKLVSENNLLLEKVNLELPSPHTFLLLVSIYLISQGIPLEKQDQSHPLYGDKLIRDPKSPIFIKHQNLRI